MYIQSVYVDEVVDNALFQRCVDSATSKLL